MDTISRQAAITILIPPKWNRKYLTTNLDDAYELGWDDCQKCIEALPSVQSEQKWIPVSKKLPKEDTPVLVTDDVGGMATVGIDSCGRYEDTGERFWYTSQNVTAWMYTVEPYGGEQDV